MPDVKTEDGVAINAEQNFIDVRRTTVKKLTKFEG